LCPALAKGTACDRSCFLKVPCRRADRRALLPRRTQLSWSVTDEHAVEIAEASKAAARVS
jgi:hypothetical protein